MHTLSTLLLAPVFALSAIRLGLPALLFGALLRLGPLSVSLFYWLDLRREIAVCTAPFARLFRIWRAAAAPVLILGGLARVVALWRPGQLPLGAAAVAAAGKTRASLAARFPVMLSLLRDAGGLAFGGGALLAGAVVYMVYLFAFVADFGRVRMHRDSRSLLTIACVRAGVYRSNASPWEAADGDNGSFLPSRAMLLRPREGMAMETSMLSNSAGVVPIFSLLDKEEEVMRKEGITRWIKTREELEEREGVSEKTRCLDALLSWARPMEEEQLEMTFEEFFQTLEDDEFQYDPTSGDWIFGDGEGEGEGKMAEITERVLKADDESEVETSELETLLRDVGKVDLKELTNNSALDPSLREWLLNQSDLDDDASTDSPTLFA